MFHLHTIRNIVYRSTLPHAVCKARDILCIMEYGNDDEIDMKCDEVENSDTGIHADGTRIQQNQNQHRTNTGSAVKKLKRDRTPKRHKKDKKTTQKKKKYKRKHYRSDLSSSSSSSSQNSCNDTGNTGRSLSSDDDRSEYRRDDTTSSKKQKRTNEGKKSRSKTKSTKQPSIDDARLAVVVDQKQQNHEERQQRRAMARAALIENKFGYTADSNPFNDPNLVETFVWNKKKQLDARKHEGWNSETGTTTKSKKTNTLQLMDEIDKVRERRQNREEQKMEMERIKAEESRMKEYEHYDQFQQKEEMFHLQQQKLRSAIRLINNREKPIDIFAKHILLFGGLASSSSESLSEYTSVTKYQEQYNVMDIAMETLDFEIEEPYLLLKSLTLHELQELSIDIDAFRNLEREATITPPGDTPILSNHAVLLQYWDNLYIVTMDEIKYLQQQSSHSNVTIGVNHSKMVEEVSKIFVDQSICDLTKMKDEIEIKLKGHQNTNDEKYDVQYWTFVHGQILVYIAKYELSQLHSKMLARQLQRLEQKKQELQLLNATISPRPPPTNLPEDVVDHNQANRIDNADPADPPSSWTMPVNVPDDMLDDLEEELGLANEVSLARPKSAHRILDNDEQYRSRKPRYYNRVKSGYDWSKYNQTHYDRDNPPPKIVQGYKFNIFYPDLINPMMTPQYALEPVVINGVVSSEYCILRFHAGPPYEDIAFQIVNREWNRSRKRGYKCTFERGVLSLYFNFTTHWYRK